MGRKLADFQPKKIENFFCYKKCYNFAQIQLEIGRKSADFRPEKARRAFGLWRSGFGRARAAQKWLNSHFYLLMMNLIFTKKRVFFDNLRSHSHYCVHFMICEYHGQNVSMNILSSWAKCLCGHFVIKDIMSLLGILSWRAFCPRAFCHYRAFCPRGHNVIQS